MAVSYTHLDVYKRQVQLAASLAEAGKKVMFIDADLRKSVLLGRFRIHQNVKGLVHLLSGQAQLADVICMTDAVSYTHLDVYKRQPQGRR